MRAKKSLGQNFLHDDEVIGRIVNALDLSTTDSVIEIGPGQGALTTLLLEKARNVTAIEFDRDLIAHLDSQFSSFENFDLINEDALSFSFVEYLEKASPSGNTKLVANLPYNISTPILQRLIVDRCLFSIIVLMFQREVVERITAPAGVKARGYLSVLVENSFKTERLFDVSPTAFHPVPRVWSSVVRLTAKTSVCPDTEIFRKIVSTSFSQKRKTLCNNLKSLLPNAAEILHVADIDGNRRAETLTLVEWKALTAAVSRN